MKRYEALREGAAWIDLSARGQIRATGEDRARLLHAICTNDVQHLEPGNGLYAFFLDDRGHILADAYIYNLGESFLLDTEPETGRKLFEHIDRYIIADDVTLEEETGKWSVIGIEGPQAVENAAALEIPVPQTQNAIALWNAGFVVRVRSAAIDGVRVFVPTEARRNFIEELERLEIAQADDEAARVVRIENGLPRYGEEITERNLVQETQRMHAVSFTKGCYLGQEIVERVRARGQVHRLLMPVRIKASVLPEPGSKLSAGGSDAAEIVSAAYSPAFGEIVALAYVRAEVAREKPRLTLKGSEVEAVLQNL